MSPFRTILIFVALTLVGFAASFFLEVDFTPDTSSSSFIISFSSDQNDPPLVTEQKITSILEGVLSGIEGLKKIASVSRYGGGNITLTFEGSDMQARRLQILTAIRQVRSRLPPNLPFPLIEMGNNEDTKKPLLIYSVTSTLPTNEIVAYTRQQLLPKIGLSSGIKSIELSTDSRPVVEVSYDLAALEANGLSISQVETAVRTTFFREQLGTITSNGETKSFFVNTNAKDIRDLLRIKLSGQLALGDIAAVKMNDFRPSYISRLDGKNAILIRLFAHEHENKPRLAAAVKNDLASLEAELPGYLSLQLSYDDTEFITKELDKITVRALLSIAILSVLVLLIYRRLDQLMVLIGSVIVSIGLSGLFMYLFSVPVHLYTIAGLTISFGLVIDNSIMVIDHWQRKKNLKVITALLAATLTTIAALLVIFVLPKEERMGMGDFALAITIALGSSVIVSLLFTPAFWTYVAHTRKRKDRRIRLQKRRVKIQHYYGSVLTWIARYKRRVFILLILSFGFPVYLIPKNIEGFSLYNLTIGSDHYQENIRPVSDKILGGMLRSFYLNVFESSGYRTPEKTQLYVTASLDEGHTIEQMNEIIQNVENYLSTMDGLASYRTTIYSGKYAQVVIEFSEETEAGLLPYVLKNRLIQRSLDWGGVDWRVYGVGRGFSNASGESLPSFRVKLMGYNYDELGALADSVASRLLVHPRIKEVNTNDRISWRDAVSEQFMLKPDLQIETDTYLTSLAAAKGNAPKLVPQMYMTIGDSRFPLILTEQNSETYSIYRLLNEGSNQPLSANASLVRQVKTNALYRESRQYVRVLSFEYYGSFRFGDQFLKKVLDEYVFPVGYSFERQEYNWGSEKTRRQYALILLILVIIFVICTATFESLKLPFCVLLIVPLSFIGIFITFSWGGFYFDQGGYAAFILLAGIVVNATIFILNEARNYRSNHWNKNLIKACSRKFAPILLTIVSTCLGLVPFLIEGQQEVFWFSFAVGVIGGLLFSVFLVFVIFPVLVIKK